MSEALINDLYVISPELFLAVSGFLFLMIGAFLGNRVTGALFAGIVAAFAAAALLLVVTYDMRLTGFGGMMDVNPFTAFAKILVLLGAAGVALISYPALKRLGIDRFEYPVLMLFSVIGMMLLISANHLLSFYVALELQALCLYVLAAFHRDNSLSSEAGLKYFVLGALSSGMMLFGASLVYGNVGSLGFSSIANALIDRGPTESLGAMVGLVFILSGFAFKISAVPFHMWTPDVYHGAPTPVTAFFAAVPKVAAMAFLIKILTGPFMISIEHWAPIIVILSVASMVWAAFAGLIQISLKRLVAYSSIGNVGYALMGVVAASPEGMAAVLVYLAIYMVMTVGIFSIVINLQQGDAPLDRIADLAGLSQRYPYAAYALAIFLFSLSGIPPLAGFLGKFVIFQAVVAQGWFYLAVTGVVASVIASFYYLRIIKIMFFDAPGASTAVAVKSPAAMFVSVVCVALIAVLLLMPAGITDVALDAVRPLFFR